MQQHQDEALALEQISVSVLVHTASSRHHDLTCSIWAGLHSRLVELRAFLSRRYTGWIVRNLGVAHADIGHACVGRFAVSSPSIATGAISAAAANGPTIAVNQLSVNPGDLTVRYRSVPLTLGCFSTNMMNGLGSLPEKSCQSSLPTYLKYCHSSALSGPHDSKNKTEPTCP